MKSSRLAFLSRAQTQISVKTIASLLTVVFVFDAIAVPLAQARQYGQVWDDRKQATSPQVASLPSTMNPLMEQLPTLKSELPTSSQITDDETKHVPPMLRTLVGAIPQNRGTVRDIFTPAQPSRDPVVLIQDVHMNAEAQLNLADVINGLIFQAHIRKLAVEGASAPFDFDASRRLADKKLRTELAEAFVKKNLMGVASYVGISNDATPPIVGVDDAVHYTANVDAYLASRADKKNAQRDLADAKRSLQEEKVRVFSPQLLAFDALRNDYHEGRITFGPYLKKLMALTPDTDFVIEQFLQAYEMEGSLDFNRVESERRQVLSQLARVLKTEDMTALLERSLAYRSGQIGFGSYYRYMKSVCERNGIVLRNTPAFDNYIRYVLLSDGIKADLLFSHVAEKEEQILRLLARTPEEKKLASQSHLLQLSEKLIEFELTPDEWDAYRNAPLDEKPVLKTSLGDFERFYVEADIRSKKMVENLFADKKSGPVALVMGGFHTVQVTRILREQNVPYVVVSPKLSKVSDESGSAYLSEFSRDKTPLEKLFTGSKLFVLPVSQEPWALKNPAAEWIRRIYGALVGSIRKVTRTGKPVEKDGLVVAQGNDGDVTVKLPEGTFSVKQSTTHRIFAFVTAPIAAFTTIVVMIGVWVITEYKTVLIGNGGLMRTMWNIWDSIPNNAIFVFGAIFLVVGYGVYKAAFAVQEKIERSHARNTAIAREKLQYKPIINAEQPVASTQQERTVDVSLKTNTNRREVIVTQNPRPVVVVPRGPVAQQTEKPAVAQPAVPSALVNEIAQNSEPERVVTAAPVSKTNVNTGRLRWFVSASQRVSMDIFSWVLGGFIFSALYVLVVFPRDSNSWVIFILWRRCSRCHCWEESRLSRSSKTRLEVHGASRGVGKMILAI